MTPTAVNGACAYACVWKEVSDKAYPLRAMHKHLLSCHLRLLTAYIAMRVLSSLIFIYLTSAV